jgi:hypothetical protein
MINFNIDSQLLFAFFSQRGTNWTTESFSLKLFCIIVLSHFQFLFAFFFYKLPNESKKLPNNHGFLLFS